jgi:CubicO group peptidase (beta-lactamase class C family)
MRTSTRIPALLLLALALGVSGSFLWVRAQDRSLDPATLSSIDEIFAQYDNDASPGCALIVMDRDEVEYRRGYGMANLEHGIPIDSSSVFRTGSVSKQFTAAVVALLAQDGVLSLDDPVQRYLPEMPDLGHPMTIRHLLHHTSGVRDYLDLMALAGRGSDDFYRKEQALGLLARQEGLNFTPGTRFLYSNSGYFLLSQVVERATGRSLRAEAQDRIFGPLGMNDTHFHDDRSEIVIGRSDGYSPRETGGYEIAMTKLDLVGDGGVFTTIDDLGLWLASMEDESLGGRSFMRTLLTRGVLSDGSTLSYAMGIGHGTHRGLPYVGHGGSFVGFRAATLRFPEEHFSVGLLCNRADVDPMGVALAVAEEVLENAMEPAPLRRDRDRGISPEAASAGADSAEASGPPPPNDILGSYYSPELDARYELRVEDGTLVAEIDGIRTLPLVFQAPDLYEALFITLRVLREEGRVVGFEAALPRASAIRFEKR